MLKKAAGLTRPTPARRGWAGEKIDFFSILLGRGFIHAT
jgi:hypothetical protein